jgi:hypothetical protein
MRACISLIAASLFAKAPKVFSFPAIRRLRVESCTAFVDDSSGALQIVHCPLFSGEDGQRRRNEWLLDAASLAA